MRTTMMKRWLCLMLGALGAASAAGAARSETLLVGQLPLASQGEVVAAQQGFHKMFGLDVEVKIFRDGPALAQALISGDLKMVVSGIVPMLHLVGANVPVYFLASSGMSTPASPLGTIVIRPDDETIKTFADLKGKKVGQLGRGVNTDMWLAAAVAHYGMKRTDFQEVLVPFPQMGGLLASKQVDAVYAYAPFDTIMDGANQGKVLMDDGPWNPYSVGSEMTVRRDWADAHPDIVRAMVKAEIATNRWIDDHPNEARKSIGEQLKLPEPVYSAMRMPYFPRNGYVAMPGVWNMYYSMLKAEQIKPLDDPAAAFAKYWVEPAKRFIAPALEELGSQADPTIDQLMTIQLPDLPGPAANYVTAAMQ
jgi:ABC-type nitrate/sulfonate/bicarbonate transport system substrate-binding protein